MDLNKAWHWVGALQDENRRLIYGRALLLAMHSQAAVSLDSDACSVRLSVLACLAKLFKEMPTLHPHRTHRDNGRLVQGCIYCQFLSGCSEQEELLREIEQAMTEQAHTF